MRPGTARQRAGPRLSRTYAGPMSSGSSESATRDLAPTARQSRKAALDLARRKYLGGEKLDIGRMADELGVNRVTLYRWVGTKDTLLVDVLWALTEEILAAQWLLLRDQPGPRVPALLATLIRESVLPAGSDGASPEGSERTMRLLTMADFDYQPRFVAAVRGYLAEDLAEHRISSDLGLDDLAYATVRIAESYYHLPTIAGLPPDPERCQQVLGALLHS